MLSRRFVFTLLATTLFISTYYLLLPVLPVHMLEMGGSKFVIGLIMGLFSASSLIFRPIAGRSSDQKGPLKIMRLSILIFFASPLFYLADSFLLIGAVQLLYGFTIGAFTISSATIVTNTIPADQLSQAIGLHSIALILAKGMSPTFGTILYKSYGLTAVLLLTILNAALALFFVSRLDLQPPPQNVPPVPFSRVISQRMVWLPSVVLLTVTMTFGTIMTMLPLLAIERQISHYSLFFTVNTLAVIITRLFSGKQSSFTQQAVIAVSLVILTLAVFLVSIVYSLNWLILTAFIYGIGYGAAYPALSTLVVLNTPVEYRGAAFGIFTAFFDIGVTLGSFWGGLSEFFGFQLIYSLASAVPLLGLFTFLFFLRGQNIWRRLKEQ